MTPRGSRIKGKKYERDIAVIFRRTFKLAPKECYRMPMSGAHMSMSLTDPGDIWFCPEFRDWFGYHVECKNHRRVSLAMFFKPDTARRKFNKWIAQACNGPTNLTALLVFKVGRDSFCAMPEDGWPGDTRSHASIRFMRNATSPWRLTLFETFLARIIEDRGMWRRRRQRTTAKRILWIVEP